MSSPNTHLRKKKEFELIFKTGRSSYDQLMGLKILQNTLTISRFGIVVSTKVSKKAVLRNRLRRQIRYIITKHPSIKTGYDMVIIVLPAALEQPFADLEQSFLFHVRRLRVYS